GTSWSLVVLCVSSAAREGRVTASVAYCTRPGDGPGRDLGPYVLPGRRRIPTASNPPAEKARTVGMTGPELPTPAPPDLASCSRSRRAEKRPEPDHPEVKPSRWSPSHSVSPQAPGSRASPLGPCDSDPSKRRPARSAGVSPGVHGH